MRNVLPTPAVQAAIFALKRAVQQAYGEEAFASICATSDPVIPVAALCVGTSAEILALANGMQQQQFQAAPRQAAPRPLLRPPAPRQLPANVNRRMLVATVIG